MRGDVSVRTGVVIQLTLIAVASLSLLAVFSLKVIETSMERRHAEAAVSVAYAVRSAVEAAGSGGGSGPVPVPADFVRHSPYIQEVTLLPEGPPADGVVVEPAGEKAGVMLSVHPAVDVTLPLAGGPEGTRGIRVRFFSPGIEREARYLVRITGLLVGADIVVMVLFGAFLMDRSVARPLRRLASVSERIAAGNYRLRADETPGNEVGQLGASFNRMVAAILSAREKARQAEHDAYRAEKLATVGRLAAGVAHEVGSPLMAVRGYAEYLGKVSASRAEQEECLDKIIGETRKIENIVRGLLSVAAPGGGEEDAEADVDAVVREAVELLSFRKMFRDIEVRAEYGEVGKAGIAPGPLQQVLLNLLLNAVDAMKNGGVLRVRTYCVGPVVTSGVRNMRRRATDPADADVAPLRAGKEKAIPKRVAVSVSDTGDGIRPEDLEAVFDPFFTTKEPGEGTGLGLSVSRAIVEGAGGEIRAESDKGKGSIFTVILPVRPEGTAAAAAGETSDG